MIYSLLYRPTFNCEDFVRTIDPSDESGSEKKQVRVLKKPASLDERVSHFIKFYQFIDKTYKACFSQKR